MSEFIKILDMFCPNCGRDSKVYEETGEGDYYMGTEFRCINCYHGWHLPSGVYELDD